MEVLTSNTMVPAVAESANGGVTLVTGAALLSEAAKNSQTGSTTFATDIDSAEKGMINTATVLLDMKRISAPKSSELPPEPIANPKQNTREEGSSTGANRYVEVHTAVEGAIEELADQENTSVPILINSPANSTTSSKGEDTTSTEEKISEVEDEEGKQRPPDMGLDRIIERNYETYPQGWPQLAAFLNSADNHAIFRRFGTAHCRVLLHLMAEITSIEKELDTLDMSDFKDKKMHYRLKRNERYEWKEHWDPAQKNLLEKLQKKISEYDAILLQDNRLRALDSPPPRDFGHVFQWIWDRKPLDIGEYDFIYHRDDCVSSNKISRSPFDGMIESLLSRWPNARLPRFLKAKDEVQGTGDPEVYFFSRSKIVAVGRLIAVCVAVTVLLIPILLLYLTQMSRSAVAGMVLAFVLTFAALMSLFTNAGVEMVFIGTCTYCAVMVTFMGNVQGSGG